MIETINKQIKDLKDTKPVSDGYHTFGELYKHRFHLYIALAKQYTIQGGEVTRSKIHEDGLNVWKEWGMFLLVLYTDKGQISYHLDKEYWDKCFFACTREKALIKFDGHTSDDVLERLLSM